MDTHQINICVFAELMGIDPNTLRRWYAESLSDFKTFEQDHLHKHDVIIESTIVEVPLLCSNNIGKDMCIDEKKIGEEWYTILSNNDTGKIALCANTTRSDYLIKAIQPLLPELCKIETITRDMAASYEKFCNDIIPNATQIADKFHVLANLFDAMQAVRIRYRQKELEKRRFALQEFKAQETQRQEHCEAKGIKYTPKRFSYKDKKLANGETTIELLARSHYLLYKFPNQWTYKQNQRAKVLFTEYPEIEKAYKLACQFRKWYAKSNISKHLILIEKDLYQWYQDVEDESIDEMLNFQALVESNQEVIIPYFNKGRTNAKAENLNGKIKKYISSNRGVKNKNMFFYRINKLFASTSK